MYSKAVTSLPTPFQSNEWQGQKTFGSKCLHDYSAGSNPYLEAFGIISRTLADFDDDNYIPVYGFGDGKFWRLNPGARGENW